MGPNAMTGVPVREQRHIERHREGSHLKTEADGSDCQSEG